MADEKAIVPAGTTEILPPEQRPEDVMEVIERRTRLIERLLTYSIGATDPRQWTKLGDKPWPGGPACEAMARRCGCSWKDVKSERTILRDDDGGPKGYAWTYGATFYLPGNIDSIYAEGHCDSRDQFLGTGPDGSVRELCEVVEGNIRQAAMTNMVVNGVTRILGVRNLTFERLDAIFAGQGGTAGMAKVDYKSGAKGGGKGSSSQDVEIKFGRCKGKMLSECEDKDIAFYVNAWRKELDDPEKSKYHRFSKANIEIAERILAERKATTGKASAWQRIVTANERFQYEEETLKHEVARITGKANAKDLTDDDVAKVIAAFEEEERRLNDA